MTIKAIIKQASAENIVQVWSRHDPARPFAHLRLSGVTARQAYNAFDEDAAGIFVYGHPTLGDWANVPALYKAEGGGPLHVYMGRPSLVRPDGEGFDWSQLVELDVMVLGRIHKFCNGRDTEGEPYLALAVSDDATLLDSLQPAAIAWRSDTTPWASAPSKYKLADGSPRIDIDQVQDVTQIWPPAVPS